MQEIVESVPDPDNAVAYPDHPLLVRGPDVLAGIGDRVIAYFVYSTHGSRPSSPSERARTLLSRLALPQNTTFVLVVAQSGTALRDNDVELFDAVQYGTPTTRGSTENWDAVGHRVAMLVGELRSFHLQRFADAWAARETGAPRRRRQGIPTSRLRPERPHRLSRGFDLADGRLYAPRPVASDRLTLKRWAAKLVNTAVDLDYAPSVDSLEETVDALGSRDAYLPIHEAPAPDPPASHVFDILKPYRATAFAGYHMNVVTE